MSRGEYEMVLETDERQKACIFSQIWNPDLYIFFIYISYIYIYENTDYLEEEGYQWEVERTVKRVGE